MSSTPPKPDPNAPDEGALDFRTTVMLVHRLKGGDDDAFRRLFERHYERVLRIAASRLNRPVDKCREDIEQVAIDAFTYAWTKIQAGEFDEFRQTEGGFRSWLATIVTHKVIDLKKRENAQKRGGGQEKLFRDLYDETLSELNLAAQRPSPTESARANELGRGYDECLLALRERHRRVLELRDLAQMSYEEIAEELGFRNIVTVRSLLHRARKELEKRMRDAGYLDEDRGPDASNRRT